MSGSNGTGAARGWGAGAEESPAAALRRRFPSFNDLQRRARRRVSRFAYDFVAGGVGDGAPNVAHNRAAMDAVRILPRYALDLSQVSTETEIFGRRYAAPVGVAPMGNIGMVWPRIDAILAAAAQKARIPYVSSTVANVGMEELARIAPDSFWFQLYGLPGDNHRLSFDLIKRAEAVGAHALAITLDVPMRQKRVHDIRNGLVLPFRYRPRTVLDIARAPFWALEMLRRGQPRFENMRKYVGENASIAELASFTQRHMTTGVTWEDIARFRDAWPRALVLKGLQHPADAEKAVALGIDGIWVSNHGGRQFDAAPASIDTVPAIAAAVGGRAKILFDGSIRSGLDVLRSLAVGADFCFAGRAFCYSVAALGEAGGDHAAAAFAEEIRTTFGQAGMRNVAEAAAATVLHPGAVRFDLDGNALGQEAPRARG
ncbi:alpha-hydroxy-acid oxidizing protein [Siccirubricoccus sp. KC 17139]|uniref:Alpha-hydroxy-acid oxidizing protein n=1 Tax=Siccirubricoccus soli TaxID=2899147 RepID=A0ABT1DCT7_9PROT|nr:alpha-hydroxy acid oxidase [Siccirubricoccus soli]MCO6418755.1 alpha-hydroxy-acid oxidizing protein [Siccirubricoccus soli]MCP2684890.1 alpha-hydroxy-acid oxidizing protein [Siccirubricoccus soli]